MSEIKKLIEALESFRDERDWKQFHDNKNLGVALSIEVAELNELFLWKDSSESEKVDKEKLKEELADVFAYALLIAGKNNFDVSEIVTEKIKKNSLKYPVELAKGNSKKYDQL